MLLLAVTHRGLNHSDFTVGGGRDRRILDTFVGKFESWSFLLDKYESQVLRGFDA